MPARLKVSASSLEETLASQIEWAGLPKPDRQYKFHPLRKWKVDFAWHYMSDTCLSCKQRLKNGLEAYPIAVEVQGGLFLRNPDGKGGRHSRGAGQIADFEKWTELSLMGWKLILVTSKEIKNGNALRLIERGLGIKGNWNQ